MKAAALIAVLPLLAGVATARPRPSHPSSSGRTSIRKSLNYAPTHSHATFELLGATEGHAKRDFVGASDEVDVEEVARRFIGSKVGGDEGEAFYIREDTYTDSRTGITHIYAKQILNGLEVSDGDINVNIDRSGQVISWGNSFHPGTAPALMTLMSMPSAGSGETDKACVLLKDHLKAHQDRLAQVEGDAGPWALVKSAAQVLLPIFGSSDNKEIDDHEVKNIEKHMKHISNHIDALCTIGPVAGTDPESEDGKFLSPIEALLSLLSRVSDDNGGISGDISPDDFASYPHHSLAPKNAPAEPPTQMISGSGLAKAGVKNHVPARFMYTQTSEGDPRLVWKLDVEMESNWYEAYVDVVSGELLRIVDWAKDYSWGPSVEIEKDPKQKPLPKPPKTDLKPYSYQIFPWGINDPTGGNLSIVTEPWDDVASPLGWHQFPKSANPWPTSHIPGMNTTGNMTTCFTTIGNNVIAHEDWEGQSNYLLNYRPINESLTFVYDYGEPDGLAPKEYVDFVITQLFYTSNMYHDLTYRLGFDEAAGNFQAFNFENGGHGGDPVIANAQDGSGMNNANFMTPPDGQSGRMRMYVWDTATPYRDGDIEAGIIIHELSHGLSTRLTGGPMNSGCLGMGEAGGMGEGWGDALATLIRQIEEHNAFENGTEVFSMGAWAANRDTGIRNYKYSTNSTVNPSTYKTLDKPGYWGVHAIGEVWAELLFVMSQRLIEKYGFSSTLFPPLNTSLPNEYYTKTFEESIDSAGKPIPLVPKHGNTLSIQLIIDAMKLQPCRPSFFDARDAIIQADQVLTGGDNACLIWHAFAERGLGSNAKIIGQLPWGGGIRTDGYEIPLAICKEEKLPKPHKPSKGGQGDDDDE